MTTSPSVKYLDRMITFKSVMICKILMDIISVYLLDIPSAKEFDHLTIIETIILIPCTFIFTKKKKNRLSITFAHNSSRHI